MILAPSRPASLPDLLNGAWLQCEVMMMKFIAHPWVLCIMHMMIIICNCYTFRVFLELRGRLDSTTVESI
jgi:hypothetical protein